ncbi:disease resistance protein RUN1 isoform X6 [Glycine max]|uniref:disease resistance protein RUN1 isoform X6 n=1 Tax=Glycine max TaxID=3847 RepID=UPI0003DE96C6|nr:disease resistance protein RUN1 isoform X6 [Glycine max]|eukprot:XP_025981861.1 TMV resistance protein N isoform X3 [Glycine max]
MAATTRSPASIYDVFLSFRGLDTRHGFTGNLYKALDDRGIYTFIDDQELPRGDEITPALSKAIQESRIAITVLSQNYASSSFCLDELVTVLLCKRKGLLVIPVFYNVDPSDVRQQKGSYGEAMAKHQKRFKAKKEKLQKWRMALHQVADLSGYHFKDGDAYEYKFIQSIVEQVSREINRTPLHVADYPVGLGSQVIEVRKLLDVGSHDVVHIIGIHGMGGLGKTTLALAVYNLIALHFDESCFLQNVREESNKHGLKHLQSIILSKLLGEKDINLTSWQEGASMIQHRLQRKKVLLILDDVDKRQQLKAIVGRPDWFGPGSRVIITTRDKHILKYHEVERTYEVKVLNQSAALQLLKWNAFKREKNDPSYEDVLNRVVTYASGLPLALEIIGSNLFGKTVAEWESAMEHYKRIPSDEILEILKVSFDALGEEQKNVFLDIACCLKGCKLTEVEHMLRGLYDNCMKHHIDVLVDKSLTKVRHGIVEMHDLIQDMGREIERQRSPEEPGKRKRLWSPKDIIQVLKHNTGTSKIEIIYVDFSISDKEETVEWNENAFMKMENLKILIIRNGKFSKGPNYFPQGLRVLEWHRYPSNCLPSNFDPINLVICKLPDSSMTSFEFHGSSKASLKSIFSSFHGSSKKLGHLTVLKFDKCKFLTQIPDVSDLPNLRELSFVGCESLVAIDDSIGFLNKLEILNAAGCRKLTSFPPLNLTSLETLELSHCSSLEYFPEILGEMENITALHLERLPIKELPFSFQNLIGLREITLRRCRIVRLRCSLAMMPNLFRFQIRNCNSWQWVESEAGEEKVEVRYPNVLEYEKEKKEEGVLELESSLIKGSGIHIFREEGSMEEDIRFDDPYLSSSASESPSLLQTIALGTRKFSIAFFLFFSCFFILLFWFQSSKNDLIQLVFALSS